MSAFYKTNMLSWIFIMLSHWNNSLCCFTLDIFSWFWANQSLLLFLTAVLYSWSLHMNHSLIHNSLLKCWPSFVSQISCISSFSRLSENQLLSLLNRRELPMEVRHLCY